MKRRLQTKRDRLSDTIFSPPSEGAKMKMALKTFQIRCYMTVSSRNIKSQTNRHLVAIGQKEICKTFSLFHTQFEIFYILAIYK